MDKDKDKAQREWLMEEGCKEAARVGTTAAEMGRNF